MVKRTFGRTGGLKSDLVFWLSLVYGPLPHIKPMAPVSPPNAASIECLVSLLAELGPVLDKQDRSVCARGEAGKEGVSDH